MTQRYGCHYCFRTLDPDDAQAETTEALQCLGCGAVYHKACWHEHGSCIRCNSSQAAPVTIAQTSPLLPTGFTQAIRIRPSAVVRMRADSAEDAHHRAERRERIVRVLRVILALQIALLLISLVGVMVQIEFAGSVGGVLLLAAYALVSYQKLASDSVAYQLMNLLGSSLLVISSAIMFTNYDHYGALALVIVNALWILVGLATLARARRAQTWVADETDADLESEPWPQ